MKYVRLGSTGLKASVAGLGTGGPSRLGVDRPGTDPSEVIRIALNLGINVIDTAPGYQTEEVVGAALAGRRDEVILCTKVRPLRGDGTLVDRRALREAVEASLVRLQTDRIDILYLQSLAREHYAYCAAELAPELLRMQEAGMIRFLGLSENYRFDAEHEMLDRAVADDWWDVAMVDFNILNPHARTTVLPKLHARGRGVVVMSAARNIEEAESTSQRPRQRAIADGSLSSDTIDIDRPLGFLVHDGGAESIREAGYRFVRHQPEVDVVLVGTGDVAHLRSNAGAINRPPLADADLAQLALILSHL